MSEPVVIEQTITNPAPAPAAAAPKPAEPVPAVPAPAANPWDDPKAAEAEIARLRRENASDRTNAKAAAADEARKALAQQIGKAIGLVEDEPDPATLTAALTASQDAAQKARVELAVFRAAGAAQGDPSALLDSTSFLRSLDGIDPSDTAAVQAAITTAVAANPRLGAATTDPAAPKAPAPNPAQGAGGGGPVNPAQLTKQDVERMYAEKKYDEIAKAQVEGRLNFLLTGTA